jgi:hypothetical protein
LGCATDKVDWNSQVCGLKLRAKTSDEPKKPEKPPGFETKHDIKPKLGQGLMVADWP